MNLMGSSLKNLAGGGLEKLLEKLTTSKIRGVGTIKGWALGLGVTGIIQSSAATTIMLIGFVNAGIMTLAQAIPVVYGANIGSTVTAQILRLGDISSGNIFLTLLKPSSFAPTLVAIGAFIYIFIKSRKMKDIAGILLGLGTLFYGMTMMEEVFAPLKESDTFKSFFLSFENPLLGILTGLVLTAIIQSSSASVGILQALSATGSVTYATAVPIIIGQNIGKCMTIILGSIGANKKAKRVALSYLLFNIVGALFFTVIIYTIYYTVGIKGFSDPVNRGDIANIHLGFNLIISLVLMPFSKQMADVTGKILKDTDEVIGEEELRALDDMLLKTPGIALAQCKKLMRTMGEKIMENYDIATKLIFENDNTAFNILNDNESFIDKCETALSAYVVKIDKERLTIDNRLMMLEILNSIGDYERIGDYAMNIAYVAKGVHEDKVVFSKKGRREIESMVSATRHLMSMTFDAMDNDKKNEAGKVEALARSIAKIGSIISDHHVQRLQVGDCGVAGGLALYDFIHCFERIGVHGRSIARHIIKRLEPDRLQDEMHGKIMNRESEEYQALEKYYLEKYMPKKKEKTEEAVSAEANVTEEAKAKTGSKDKSAAKDKNSAKDKEATKSKSDKKDKVDKKAKSDKTVKTDKAAKTDKADKKAKSDKKGKSGKK
ncbi:MAG: Na/Pi cotransporter family protein [Eubacterium sp.]|nr:Na/Pi cotransporter family protein [Eubacterium sp.]